MASTCSSAGVSQRHYSCDAITSTNIKPSSAHYYASSRPQPEIQALMIVA